MISFQNKKLLQNFVLLILIVQVISINQQCSVDSECPTQTYCSSNYCFCLPTFIIDCTIPATPISSSGFITANVDQNSLYFTYQPSALKTYMYMLINICQQNAPQNSQDKLQVWIWVDTGQVKTLNSENSFINTNAPNENVCIQISTPYMSFTNQPNGQYQKLIFGLQLNTTTSNSQYVTIKVKQYKTISQQLILIIGLSIFSCLVTICVCVIIVCIIRWKYNQMAYQQQHGNIEFKQINDIAHFDNYMPVKKAVLFSNVVGSTCSVCLVEVNQEEQVRKTPCQHFFHTQCLDSWAKKNLSCPVCRQDLTKLSLAEYCKKKMQNSLTEGNKNIMEEDPQVQGQTARYIRIKKQLKRIVNQNQARTQPLQQFLSRQ